MKQLYDGSKLGFGLMRLPKREDGSIDIQMCCEMVDRFMESGGTYFDTAFVYEGSEEAAREFLVSRYPRESYQLATKLHSVMFVNNAEQARQEFLTSLERTGAGYFDFYLLHSLNRTNYEKYEAYGLWDYVRQLKEEGKIRHYGFSFHDSPEMLDRILTEHPDAEFVQLQINYADWEDPTIASRRCYEVACRHGKPVIVMEPVKGGTLAKPPEAVRSVLTQADPAASPASWAIRFAASLENVMVVLSGMSSPAQVNDNCSFMECFEPLSEKEREVIADARKALSGIDQIGCTGCHYCTPECPQQVRIPEIFSCMNHYLLYDELKAAKMAYSWRTGGSRASDCIACGQCEAVCPQHLPIISLLEQTAKTLE